MRTKRHGRPAMAVLFLVLVTAAVVGVADVAWAPPFPQKPCIQAAGMCLDTNILIPGETGSNNRPNRPPSQPPPTGPPRPPTPAEINRQVQRDLLLEAETFLPQPEVETSTGVDVPSVVAAPTFFSVSNWLPQQVDPYEATGAGGAVWSITVTATPSLSLDPGEPGAPIIQCEDGGTRYDPNGPSPEEQAARPGACAYEYTRRTGVAGRPDAWTARLIVSWTIEWDANFPIPPDIAAELSTFETLIASVERPVEEVTTVVNRSG
jgi:hypothetical protein